MDDELRKRRRGSARADPPRGHRRRRRALRALRAGAPAVHRPDAVRSGLGRGSDAGGIPEGDLEGAPVRRTGRRRLVALRHRGQRVPRPPAPRAPRVDRSARGGRRAARPRARASRLRSPRVSVGRPSARRSADLSEEQREALVLARYHGMPYAEIAKTLGISVGAVKTRIFRAVETLKAHFSEGETLMDCRDVTTARDRTADRRSPARLAPRARRASGRAARAAAERRRLERRLDDARPRSRRRGDVRSSAAGRSRCSRTR